MFRALKRVLDWFGLWRGRRPPGSPRDPYARKPAPVKPRPATRRGSVALAEPDDE